MKKILNLIVSFISGGSIMAIELSAAKLFEPKLGNSLMLWASVIGFTMLGLALGYLLGGHFSKKAKAQQFLLLSLGLTALYCFFSPGLFDGISSSIKEMSLLPSILLSSFLILVPSLMLLGMISPLLIKLNNQELSESGKTSGTVFSVSTIGGILATLSFGLYFIPYLGITMSFKLVAVCLLFSAVLVLGNYYLSKSTVPTE